MTQYSVSYRDENGELHLIQPFFDDYNEAKHFATHNFIEYQREIIPWHVNDEKPTLAFPTIESKEIIKAKVVKTVKKDYEQLNLFDY